MIIKKIIHILFFLLFTLTSISSFSSTIFIDDDFEYSSLRDKIEILPYSKLIKIDRIIDSSIKYDFIKNDTGNVSYGYTDEIFLAQFKVKNVGTKTQTLYLKNPVISSIKYYFIEDNILLSSSEWDFTKTESPDHVFSRFPIWPISIKPDQTIKVLTQFSSDIIVVFNPELMSLEKTKKVMSFDYSFYKVFFSLLVLFLIGFILLTIFKKSLLYGIYSFFIFSTIIYNLFMLNFIHFQYDTIGAHVYAQMFLSALLLAASLGVLFLSKLFNIAKIAPPVYSLTLRYYVFIAFSISSLYIFDIEISKQMTLLLIAISNLLIIWIVFVSIYHKVEYFSLAIVRLIYQISALLIIFVLKDYIEYSDKYFYFFNAISVLEIIGFSALLIIKKVYKQKRSIGKLA